MDCRAEARGQLQTPASPTDLQPVAKQATAFAPATVANLGPGFDWLGCAVDVSLPDMKHTETSFVNKYMHLSLRKPAKD